jgi:ABC-type sugar transport system substrate-binding protein
MGMHSSIARRVVALALVGGISAVALVAAGAASARGTRGPVIGGYVYAGTSAQTAAARAAGRKAGRKRAAVPKHKTIAVIELSGTSSESIGTVAAAKYIAKMFHYSVVTCDPNFDPQKVVQCATSMVAQHPSVIISVSTNTGAMGSAYNQAIAQGIPWFDVVSAAVPARGLFNYGTVGFELTRILDKYMFTQLRLRNPGKNSKIFAIGAPTVGIASANEGKQLAADVKAAGDMTLINHDLDLSNAVQDTLTTSQQTLQQNPDLGAMWTLCDFCLPLMAQTVQKAQGSNRRTLVLGMYANPQSVAGIRNGTIDAIADYPWQASVWVLMDQVLQHWARRVPIAIGARVYANYPINFFKPYLITKKNVGRANAIPVFGPDFRTYFMNKWAKEFGVK